MKPLEEIKKRKYLLSIHYVLNKCVLICACIKVISEKRCYNWYHRNIKAHKRLLWTIICQQIGQLRRSILIPRNIQPTGLINDETETLNRPITSKEIESVIKNLPTNKSPGTYGFTGNFQLDIQRRINTNPSQALPIRRELFQ